MGGGSSVMVISFANGDMRRFASVVSEDSLDQPLCRRIGRETVWRLDLGDDGIDHDFRSSGIIRLLSPSALVPGRGSVASGHLNSEHDGGGDGGGVNANGVVMCVGCVNIEAALSVGNAAVNFSAIDDDEIDSNGDKSSVVFDSALDKAHRCIASYSLSHNELFSGVNIVWSLSFCRCKSPCVWRTGYLLSDQ